MKHPPIIDHEQRSAPGTTLDWLEHELPQWDQEGLLAPGAAQSIRERYHRSPHRGRQLGVVLISAFGACLIGAGIISLFAYNWEHLGLGARTTLSLLPLLVMQALAGLTLWRWRESAATRESVCAGLILAIGAAIALIAQTYQISGDFAQFMLTWFALALPAVYLLRSGTGFWLCQIGLLSWAGYGINENLDTVAWLPVLYATTVVYYFWIRTREDHPVQPAAVKWAFALSGPLALWFWLENTPGTAWPVIFTAYFSVGLLLDQRQNRSLMARPFAIVGAIALAIYMLAFSFNGRWGIYFPPAGLAAQGTSVVLALAWIAGIVLCIRRRCLWPLPMGALPLVILILTLVVPSADSYYSSTQPLLEVILTLYTLGVGVWTIFLGVKNERLSLLNLGLLLIGLLAIFRFFDSSFSLIAKGLGFIIVGSLFIAANVISARLFKQKGQSS